MDNHNSAPIAGRNLRNSGSQPFRIAVQSWWLRMHRVIEICLPVRSRLQWCMDNAKTTISTLNETWKGDNGNAFQEVSWVPMFKPTSIQEEGQIARCSFSICRRLFILKTQEHVSGVWIKNNICCARLILKRCVRHRPPQWGWKTNTCYARSKITRMAIQDVLFHPGAVFHWPGQPIMGSVLPAHTPT